METHAWIRDPENRKEVSNHMLFPQVKEVSDKKQNGQLNPELISLLHVLDLAIVFIICITSLPSFPGKQHTTYAINVLQSERMGRDILIGKLWFVSSRRESPSHETQHPITSRNKTSRREKRGRF